jgi:hypothetical protein
VAVLAVGAGVPWLVACTSDPEIAVECTVEGDIVPGDAVTLKYDITSDTKIDVGIGAGLHDDDRKIVRPAPAT